MLQHKFYMWEKKPAKWKKKGGKVLLDHNLLGESVERERPLSTGDLMDQKVWQVDEGIFLRSRAATYNGPTSSFYNFASTDTCYTCLFDLENGKTFCEIMGSRYCTQCIKTNRRKDIDEEVSSALGISENGHRSSSLGDTFFQIVQGSPTLAFSNDRRLFTRLHNLNSNSEYYINPTNGIEASLASTHEMSCESGYSQVTLDDYDKKVHAASQSTPNCLQIPGALPTKQGSLGKKRRKNGGGTGKMKRKFVTFNGLPIEPPLITVDLSNQIMNHLVIKDS